jgi:hypothetical protein
VAVLKKKTDIPFLNRYFEREQDILEQEFYLLALVIAMNFLKSQQLEYLSALEVRPDAFILRFLVAYFSGFLARNPKIIPTRGFSHKAAGTVIIITLIQIFRQAIL